MTVMQREGAAATTLKKVATEAGASEPTRPRLNQYGLNSFAAGRSVLRGVKAQRLLDVHEDRPSLGALHLPQGPSRDSRDGPIDSRNGSSKCDR